MSKFIEIKDTYGKVIFSSDKFSHMKQVVEHCLSNNISLKYADFSSDLLIYADLSHTDFSHAYFNHAILMRADFRGTDLSHADFYGTYLYDCEGNGKEIVTFKTEFYICNFTKDFLSIGCRTHTYEEWFNFSDDVISEMARDALEFWNKYKDKLMLLKTKYGF